MTSRLLQSYAEKAIIAEVGYAIQAMGIVTIVGCDAIIIFLCLGRKQEYYLYDDEECILARPVRSSRRRSGNIGFVLSIICARQA